MKYMYIGKNSIYDNLYFCVCASRTLWVCNNGRMQFWPQFWDLIWPVLISINLLSIQREISCFNSSLLHASVSQKYKETWSHKRAHFCIRPESLQTSDAVLHILPHSNTHTTINMQAHKSHLSQLSKLWSPLSKSMKNHMVGNHQTIKRNSDYHWNLWSIHIIFNSLVYVSNMRMQALHTTV